MLLLRKSTNFDGSFIFDVFTDDVRAGDAMNSYIISCTFLEVFAIEIYQVLLLEQYQRVTGDLAMQL